MKDGDLLTLEFAVSIDGWVADAARSVVVGNGSDEDQRLIDSTWAGLEAGIWAAQPGNRLGDISKAIGDVADEQRIPVNLDFGGHGLGHTMHEDPHVANRGKGGRGLVLKPGLTLAIEPWWSFTSKQLSVDKDGWTLRLADGSTARIQRTRSPSPRTGPGSSPRWTRSPSPHAIGLPTTEIVQCPISIGRSPSINGSTATAPEESAPVARP